MEFSGYRVEVIGGHHFSKDQSNYNHSPFSNSSRSYFPWRPLDISDQSEMKNYVELYHGDQYKLHLTNHQETRCQAKITIDGHYVGTWVVPALDSIIIERPVNINKKFTFYRVSKAPRGSGIVSNRRLNGLIEVEFIPERQQYQQPQIIECPTCTHGRSRGLFTYQNQVQSKTQTQFEKHPDLMNSLAGTFSNDYEQGGTALKGKSHQRFQRTGPLDLDYAKKVTISLRLVGKKRESIWDYDRPTPLGELRHKKSPVPPPISQWSRRSHIF